VKGQDSNTIVAFSWGLEEGKLIAACETLTLQISGGAFCRPLDLLVIFFSATVLDDGYHGEPQ